MIKKIIFLLFIVFYLTTANAENLANELKELNKLFKSGQITEEQFKKSKAKLIGIDYKPPKKEPTQTQKLSSNQIADKAYKYVHANHTWGNRISLLLSKIFSSY